MQPRAMIAAVAAIAGLTGCKQDPDEMLIPVTSGAATFAAIRTDIFVPTCAFSTCHTGALPAANLDLLGSDACATLVAAPSCLFAERQLIVPGDPSQSFLVDKLTGQNLAPTADQTCNGASSNHRMPFGGAPLPAAQIEQVRAWIAAGAACEQPPEPARDAGAPSPDAAAAVATLTPAATVIRNGTRTDFSVTLSVPAPEEGLTLSVATSDSSALGAPGQVFIAAGRTKATFPVLGKRPARPSTLTLRSPGGSSATAIVTVVGLYLVEVMARPTTDKPELMQWIKVRNDGAAPINLADYSFGAGTTSFTQAQAPLAGILPAGTCAVIGGPNSAPENGSPRFTQATAFSAALPANLDATGQPAGFALFDVAGGKLDGTLLPLDAVGCGPKGTALPLKGPNGQPLPVASPEPPPGGSLIRVAATSWQVQEKPTPDVCASLATGL